MLSLYNIWTVARFEIKTLMRSWFFRIYSIIALVLLTAINFLLFTGWTEAPWVLRGLSSAIPYANVILLNVMQAIIAVFLASDFLKRDKKLDTTEVVYMRSMTNADYVLGKTTGILFLFVGLNILVLLIGAVINGVASDVPLSLISFVVYPLLISLPTLIFIFGLSFLLMVLVRNQAVTFIILLGYIAISLFFLGNKAHFLFDYMAFNIPMPYSDLAGFSNLGAVLMQRGFYLLFGIAAIFGTILLIQRLPQSQTMQRFSLIICILSLLGGISLSGWMLNSGSKGASLREAMIELNRKRGNETVISIPKATIDLKHKGSTIFVETKLTLRNSENEPMDRFTLFLNPGLNILEAGGESIQSFDRNLHLITFELSTALAPSAETELTLKYSGSIDEAACYPDIDEEQRAQQSRAWMLNLDKRHAFIEPDYLLLTPESNWIPQAGVGFLPDSPVYGLKQFTDYQLTVSTGSKLTAVSQGQAEQLESGKTRFTTEVPIPQLSLVIGHYEKRAVTVDSVEYAIYTMPGHDFYAPYFDALTDTLPSLIRDELTEFESRLNNRYPYPRLSVIEVPVQFMGYQRLWTINYETVQPEMVLLPEKGATLFAADFKMFERWGNRRGRRSNQEVSPIETQSWTFRRFVDMTLLTAGMPGRMGRGRGQGVRVNEDIELPNWASGQSFEMSYSIYPNYYSFVNHIHSSEWPILNFAFESYLSSQSEDTRMQMFRAFSGMSSEEQVSMLLTEKSIEEVLLDIEDGDLAHEAMKAKGNTLFTRLKNKLGAEPFEIFMKDFLEAGRFRTVDVSDLLTALEQKHALNFEPEIKSWYSEKQLPGYLMSDVEAYQIVDNNRTKYQVRLTLTNPEPVDGVLIISFRTRGGGRGGFFGPSEPIEQIVQLDAGQSKSIGIVLDAAPRMMMVNTLISQNLPATLMHFFEDVEEKKNARLFEGETLVDAPVLVGPNEIVVDNENPGFEGDTGSEISALRKLLKKTDAEDEQKYKPMMSNWEATSWTATTNPAFYGQYVHSAYFIQAGDGGKKVAWNVEIPKNGDYDVYAHVFEMRFRGPGGGRDSKQDHHFFVAHDDGTEEVVIDADEIDTGWALLGNYYFSSGTARVELSNLSEGRMVFADAVKFVKQ